MKTFASILAIAVALAGCGDKTERLHGYAEGKFVMLAPETKGRTLEELERMLVRPKQVAG